MKKLGLLFAAAAMAVSVNAQTVTESKTFDNFYIGINGGAQVKTTGESWMNDLNSNAGLRIGRWFTPVFGLAAEGNVYFNDHCKHYMPQSKTVARYMNVGLIGTVNLSNWFAGYKGEPRLFEVVPVFGFGWGHTFGTVEYLGEAWDGKEFNALTSKAGIDFTFNLGKAKAWQVYVEPSMNWSLNGNGYEGVAYNINKSAFQLNAGIVYKFKNSNGTHNFTIAQVRDQAEIDGLNAKINDLRNDLNGKDSELAAKNRQIADLQKALDECNSKPKYEKPATATNLQPTVIFRQGKSVVDPAQYANIELIAQYMKNHPEATVEIKGYASPEGSKELNQKLSEARANAVKNILVKTYKISAKRLQAKGMGATDKLFKQVEFNRVATFNDNNAVE